METRECLFQYSFACGDDIRLRIEAVSTIFAGIESKCRAVTGGECSS